ncbi:MAG: prolyl aminopeptidase [Alphaproteobacteria bacterium]
MIKTDFFPPIEADSTGYLRLDGRHAMYWEEAGNPDGVPMLFLHGGPGAGTFPMHRRYFDPAHYRIILFDQRGAGRSTPQADLTDNTTWHLVADMERLREYLGIDKWFMFGGSWGSSLALAYGQKHPDRCLGFILRGIFTGRQVELDWFLSGMRLIFPEAHRNFVEFLPLAERADVMGNYYRRLVDPHPDIHLPAARAWASYEGACSTLLPSPETITSFQQERVALGLARIEAHYFVHRMFLEDGQLLRDIGAIRHLPCVIVQGRYDVVCPIMTADDLHRAWPEAEYYVIADAGHSATEPGTRRALIGATERFKQLTDGPARKMAPRRAVG